MNIKKCIKRLTAEEGVSGYERAFAHSVCEMLEKYTEDVKIDKFNNVIAALKCGRKSAKKVMLEAHLDRIGLMISEINELGNVCFENLGGVDARILPNAECYILGKENVFGIIEAKAEEGKTAKIENMAINTGFSKEYAENVISAGDPVILKSELTELLDGRFSGAAMDDRAGMVVLFDVLDKIKGKKLDFDLYILFSSQEELGMHGAYEGAEAVAPDIAIAVDVTHGITPTVKREDGAFELGDGAIICRGPNFDYELTNRLINIAEKNNIRYSIEVAQGNSGTDAWAIQTAGDGVRTMLVSIPLRYMHTTVETLEMSDISASSELISAFLLECNMRNTE